MFVFATLLVRQSSACQCPTLPVCCSANVGVVLLVRRSAEGETKRYILFATSPGLHRFMYNDSVFWCFSAWHGDLLPVPFMYFLRIDFSQLNVLSQRRCFRAFEIGGSRVEGGVNVRWLRGIISHEFLANQRTMIQCWRGNAITGNESILNT